MNKISRFATTLRPPLRMMPRLTIPGLGLSKKFLSTNSAKLETFIGNCESKWQQTFPKRSFSAATAPEPEAQQTPSKEVIGWWYLISGSLVFGIVILGGVTRLTESGLSITEWNIIKGIKPPTSDADWNEEFAKYQNFPEYKLMNQNITMDEFKRIFYFEWAHRIWGRVIGLAFVLPGLVFAYKGYMTKAIKKRSLIVACMIGTQGTFGWYMVKSGLAEEILQNRDVPRVNHFWLSAHLGSAFLIYCTMVMTGLEVLKANKLMKNPAPQVSNTIFKRIAFGVSVLVFFTAISGAWVAGLDAGLIYNEFPLMGETLVPSDMWAFSTESAENKNPMPWYENLARNPSAVQFNHRVMAITTATAVSGLWLLSKKTRLSNASKLAANALMGVAMFQVGLGISTLIYFVPIPLAAAHQAGSLSLLTMAVWLMHTLRVIR